MRHLVFFCLLLTLCAYPVSFRESLKGNKLRANAFTMEQARSMVNYAASCSAILDKTLACDADFAEWIEIKECDTVPPDAPTPADNVIVFTKDSEINSLTYTLMQALVKRRCRQAFKGKPGKQHWMTDFLAAALTFRRFNRMNSETDVLGWNYNAAIKQFNQKRFPELEGLLANQFEPDSPWLFHLNAMHNELFLQCLELIPRKRGSLVWQLLQHEWNGLDSKEALANVMGQVLPQTMSVQGWYESQVTLLVSRKHLPSNRQSIENKVKDLQQLSIVSASNPSQLECIPIDEFPNALSDFKMDKVALRKRQQQFLQLENEAPPLLKPSMKLFAKAISCLIDDTPRHFLRELENARSMFKEALAKQRKLEDFMDRMELKYIPLGRRYAPAFEILDRYNSK